MVKEDITTTMNVKRSTLKKLRKFEVHPRETHEEIVLRLIKELNRGERDDNV